MPVFDSCPESFLDSLLSQLPPAILVLETRNDDAAGAELTPTAAAQAMASMSIETKRRILTRVIRSPQLHQSLGSLTVAIRDGGLPTVAEALNIKVQNGGFIQGGAMPLGGGDAVEAFVNGVKQTVKDGEREASKGGTEDAEMDTS
jgi:26S proteasome regulatory subunit N13